MALRIPSSRGWIRWIKPRELGYIFLRLQVIFQHFHIHFIEAVWCKRFRGNMILTCTHWSHKKKSLEIICSFSLSLALPRKGKDCCNLYHVVQWNPWALEIDTGSAFFVFVFFVSLLWTLNKKVILKKLIHLWLILEI